MSNSAQWKEGEYIIYTNGDRYEIGNRGVIQEQM